MKQQYELTKDGWLEGTFENTREGLEQAYDEAYQVLANSEWLGAIESLEITLDTYNACGEHVECELVHEFAPEEIQKDNWEGAVDGR